MLSRIVTNLDRKTARYEFDTLGRLITAKAVAGGSGVANWTQSYTYDRYGNKLTTAKSGITANSAAIPLDGLPSQTYQATTNRITTSGTTYDNAGNMTRGKSPSGSFQRFEYDEAGRVKVIKTDSGTALETNTYGTSRQRLKKEGDGTRTYYAWGGSSVIANMQRQTVRAICHGQNTMSMQVQDFYQQLQKMVLVRNWNTIILTDSEPRW